MSLLEAPSSNIVKGCLSQYHLRPPGGYTVCHSYIRRGDRRHIPTTSSSTPCDHRRTLFPTPSPSLQQPPIVIYQAIDSSHASPWQTLAVQPRACAAHSTTQPTKTTQTIPSPKPWTSKVKEDSPNPCMATTADPSQKTTEQEDLISRLADENTARNTSFARLLLALPILTTVAYIPTLFRPSTALSSLLAVTSLLSTAFLLYSLPPTQTGIAILDQRRINSTTTGQRSRRAGSQPLLVPGSPLETWLPYLNLGLAVVLTILDLLRGSESTRLGWVALGNLPAIVYAVVIVAKLVMASVDPESELSALKYEYKGA